MTDEVFRLPAENSLRKNRALAICFAIFWLAVALRLPSCGESFWVDELHTAWVIANDYPTVAERAGLGNQTPWYFWGLWSWSQLAGMSEIALRFPSVLAVALASSMLTWCGWRMSSRLTVSALAGLFMAVDQNSLYFGTETRGYSFVILAVTGWVTCACEAQLATRRGAIWTAGAGVCAAAAVLMHVTSVLVVFGLAVAGISGVRIGREKSFLAGQQNWSVRLRLVGASLAGLLVGIGLSFASVKRVWAIRQQWNDFGRSDSFLDLANMWPWLWMLILPLAIHLLFFSLQRRANAERRLIAADYLVTLWSLILGITLVAWGVSYFDLAAIWHRRYIVGLLPLVCLAGAINWGTILLQINGRKLQLMAFPLVVGGLIGLQGNFPTFFGGDFRAVRRQEEWRGSIQYLNQRLAPEDQVWLAAGLIESRWLDRPSASRLTPEARDYLLFPVSGPYRVEQAAPLGAIASSRSLARISDWIESNNPSSGRLWMIVRMPRESLQRKLAEFCDRIERERAGKIEFIPFRKLTLVCISKQRRKS